jgi:uncharacterized protein with HEPN domain
MIGDALYLQHIQDAIKKIEQYAAVGKVSFMEQSHWQDSIIRQLEIIGEASKRLSEGLRDEYASVPWRRIAGLRDVLIHDYMGVDLNAVWEITQKDIPTLKQSISIIVMELEGN